MERVVMVVMEEELRCPCCETESRQTRRRARDFPFTTAHANSDHGEVPRRNAPRVTSERPTVPGLQNLFLDLLRSPVQSGRHFRGPPSLRHLFYEAGRRPPLEPGCRHHMTTDRNAESLVLAIYHTSF